MGAGNTLASIEIAGRRLEAICRSACFPRGSVCQTHPQMYLLRMTTTVQRDSLRSPNGFPVEFFRSRTRPERGFSKKNRTLVQSRFSTSRSRSRTTTRAGAPALHEPADFVWLTASCDHVAWILRIAIYSICPTTRNSLVLWSTRYGSSQISIALPSRSRISKKCVP